MKALILAAGYGTRLRPYSDHTPKPLFTIAGRPLLDIIIGQLEDAGCQAVIVNTHHLHHKIEGFLGARNYNLEVSTRYEPQILGTGGAIKNVADFWDDQPFMVINADIVVDIDLKEVYWHHCCHHAPATLVLCDNPEFNSVAVKQNQWVTGFYNPTETTITPPDNLLTFTGIQVLEPQVLDYIPQNTFYSSIDAFKNILAEGRKLMAFITPIDRWQDIGTPERYRQTVYKTVLPRAFKKAFGDTSCHRIEKKKLKGDGSERQWYRLKTGRHSLIMADHGIREKRSISEVDAFVHIGQHLYRQGVAVPKIYFFDTFCGLVFLDDLGDVNLQQTVRLTPNPESVSRLYKSVIDQLIKISLRGADNFDPAWTYQTTHYDQELIVEKECRYFQEAFLQTYLGLKVRFSDLAQEFSLLADHALENAANGFMHRDMQSRNIMVKGGKYYFIDFQGGRMGPLQYDLASLLIDPYVDLPNALRLKLFDYAAHNLPPELDISPQQFRQGCVYCALTRNLQILGAFGHLSKNKGKTYFEDYIPAALRTLAKTLSDEVGREFPKLKAIVEKIFQII